MSLLNSALENAGSSTNPLGYGRINKHGNYTTGY